MKWLGIAFATCIALLADLQGFMSGVVFALFLGILIANGPGTPGAMREGVAFAVKWALFAGIVLLGFRIDLQAILWIGNHWYLLLAAILPPIAVGLALRKHGRTPLLIGVGTAICGVSAMAAARPVLGGDDEEFAEAVGVVTILGSIGLIFYPLLAPMLSPHSYGMLAGLTLHAVPQAVGAGFAGGAVAGSLATSAKLARVASLPVLLAVSGANHKKLRFPPEVIGFFAAVLLANSIMKDQAEMLGQHATTFLLLAFAALGLQTKLRLRMGRALGWGAMAWAASLLCVGIVLYFLNGSVLP